MRTPVLIFLIAASAALGLFQAVTGVPPSVESRVSGRPVQLREDGFASSDRCQACHPSQYASWHASYHRTMTQVATPQTAATSFDNVTTRNVNGRPMRLRQQGPELWAEFDDPDSVASVDARPRIERRVTLITGSHHQQIYWYDSGQRRLLGQLPGAYLIGEQRWIPRRMAVLHPPTQQPLSETGH